VNTRTGAGVGETGGTITITGEKITLNDRATITAAGYAGGGAIYLRRRACSRGVALA
jgi:hypothetical protein